MSASSTGVGNCLVETERGARGPRLVERGRPERSPDHRGAHLVGCGAHREARAANEVAPAVRGAEQARRVVEALLVGDGRREVFEGVAHEEHTARRLGELDYLMEAVLGAVGVALESGSRRITDECPSDRVDRVGLLGETDRVGGALACFGRL